MSSEQSKSNKLILASASPRRLKLLERIGISVSVIAANIDESIRPQEGVLGYALRVSADKARAVAQAHPGEWVLAADTVVEQAGSALGKPRDRQEAESMLQKLRGGVHQVTTAIALHRFGDHPVVRAQAVTTKVSMREFSASELQYYLDGGEWQGKAGAYAVQGMAAAFVEQVRGSISNVIGLPLSEVVVLLREMNITQPTYPSSQAC